MTGSRTGLRTRKNYSIDTVMIIVVAMELFELFLSGSPGMRAKKIFMSAQCNQKGNTMAHCSSSNIYIRFLGRSVSQIYI